MKTFTGEHEYLLHLLSSVITCTQPCEKPEALSFQRIFDIASDHSVANTAFYAVEKLSVKPDEALMKKWSEIRDKALMKDIIQSAEYESICGAFSQNNIRFIPLKGFVLKRLYPQSDMRLMSDIDILIDKNDAHKAGEAMLSLGYECDSREIGIHDVYLKKPVMNVEIHRELFGITGNEFNVLFKDPWKLCSKHDGCFYEFDPSYFCVHMLAHCAKHYKAGGTGIRSFMDIWLFMQRRSDELDMAVVDSMLESVGIKDLCHDFIKLSQIWFGGEEYTEKYKEMTRYILSSGTYGNIENSVEIQLKEKSKAKYVFSQIFPSLAYMKVGYPILRKAPVLLPFCWIYRLIVRPFTRREKISAKLNAIKKHQNT